MLMGLYFNFILIYSETQTDLEEAKSQEIAKLQEALHAMQLRVDDANSLVIKEREAARKAIKEAPPVIKETPVIIQDTEKINSLTAEVENLKVSLLSCTMMKQQFGSALMLCCHEASMRTIAHINCRRIIPRSTNNG